MEIQDKLTGLFVRIKTDEEIKQQLYDRVEYL